ncbi:MAG: three-Cys-motif partner protein TcmP [Planctomycetota bacterium]|nr:three-Cys-motif partner protein TcmP [Planctomycetota bacterium]
MKDRILAIYMVPYLNKVSKLDADIIFIDAFAGPGRFGSGDDEGDAGSPIIMCEAAERTVPGRYRAIFANKNKEFHDRLRKNLSQYKAAKPVLGNAEDLLRELPNELGNETVFLYLDPFGLKGCDFELLRPILSRDTKHSTEVVVNLSILTMQRLSCRNRVLEGRGREEGVVGKQRSLTKALGGDYWKASLLAETGTPDSRAEAVAVEYLRRLSALGLQRSGLCPVREKPNSRLKYFVMFFSRHEDALLLMNNIMHDAYHETMFDAETKGTLFADLDWKESEPPVALRTAVLDLVGKQPGTTARDLWLMIVQKHFMRFRQKDYTTTIRHLVRPSGPLIYEDVRGTRRVNLDAPLKRRDSNE